MMGSISPKLGSMPSTLGIASRLRLNDWNGTVSKRWRVVLDGVLSGNILDMCFDQLKTQYCHPTVDAIMVSVTLARGYAQYTI